MQLVENQMDAIIMTVFTQYKKDEIESWTFEKSAQIYAMAEWVLNNIKGIPVQLSLEETPKQAPSIPAPPRML